jgi:hypothetical protein
MIVIVEVPAGLPAVVIVSVEVPEPVTEGGLKEAVAPEGNPLAVKLTAPVKPFSAPTLTEYVAVPPEFTDAVAGVAESEKSGFGEPSGTICMPLTGARSYPVEAVLGIADSVKPETLGIVKST